jgi:hypothetical protein
LSPKDVATLLLLLHGQIFCDESLNRITKSYEIPFANEHARAKAMSEWFYFGLHAVVRGVQNNLGDKPEEGKAIVREVFSELYFHLIKVEVTPAELDEKLFEIKERLTQFDAIFASGEYQRVGHAAAAFVLDLKIPPGQFPLTPKAFGFSLAANESYIGTLKAVNELFDSIRF